jgi:hypothetical protein
LWLAIPLEVRGSRGTNLPVAVMRLDDRLGMLSRINQGENVQGSCPMEELIDIEIETESEEVRVYAWRVEQLGKLGLSTVIADAVANLVDWHEVARLVEKGCPPELALEIAR